MKILTFLLCFLQAINLIANSQVAKYDTIYSKDARFIYELKKGIRNEDTVHLSQLSASGQIEPTNAKLIYYKNARSIPKGNLLKNLFIECMDLDVLLQTGNQRRIQLIFNGCFFREMRLKRWATYNQDVIFKDVSVGKGYITGEFMGKITFLDTDLRFVTFKDATFHKMDFRRNLNVQLQNFLDATPSEKTPSNLANIYPITFQNCVFTDSLRLYFSDYEQVCFNDCVFNTPVTFKKFIIENRERFWTEAIQYYKDEYNYIPKNGELKNARNKYDDYIDSLQQSGYATFNHFVFDNSIFIKGVKFHELNLRNCKFSGTKFNGVVDLDSTRLIESGDFDYLGNCYFKQVKLELNLQNQEVDSLGIRPEFVDDVTFELSHSGDLYRQHLDEPGWYRTELFFRHLQQNLKTSGILVDDEIKIATESLKHQSLMYEMQFWRDDKLNKYWGERITKGFLEFTVKNGYKGEFQFLKVSISIIFIFMLIYFVGYREAIVTGELSVKGNILDGDGTKAVEKARNDAKKFTLNNFILNDIPTDQVSNYIRWFLIDISTCLMCSGRMFILPQFPLKYFTQNDKSWWLLFFLFAEWVIGIVMMGLFLYYIAAQYSFVTKLLGI